MYKPPMPFDEAARLATLRACNILDTGAEEAFNELVALSTQLTGAPISLISLIDESRQWFKASVGLNVCETLRDHAFCATAILEPTPLIVEDTRNDLRFKENPLVTGTPGIRFYAGFPLQMSDGTRPGTLCVIDTEPRQLTSAQYTGLLSLSHQACAQMDLRRALHELRALRAQERHSADRNIEDRAKESFHIGQLLERAMADELRQLATTMRAAANVPSSEAELRSVLTSAGNSIADVAMDCRMLAARVRDFSLLSVGWLETVRADIRRLRAEHHVSIEIECDADPDQLLGYVAAYRLSEFAYIGMTAAISHWHSRKLTLTLSKQGAHVHLSIRHDGARVGDIAASISPTARLYLLAAELNSVLKELISEECAELRLSVPLSPLEARLHSSTNSKH